MTKNIFPIGFTSWMFLHSKGNIKYCLDFFPVLFPSFSGLFCIICASAVELSFTASFHRVLVLACWYFVVVENFVKKLSKNINYHNTRSRSQLTKITTGMKLLVKGNDFWHIFCLLKFKSSSSTFKCDYKILLLKSKDRWNAINYIADFFKKWINFRKKHILFSGLSDLAKKTEVVNKISTEISKVNMTDTRDLLKVTIIRM